MKPTHALSAAMVAVSLLAAGCASNAPTSTNYSTQADASTYGTIENIVGRVGRRDDEVATITLPRW